jgi:hypothetical protein
MNADKVTRVEVRITMCVEKVLLYLLLALGLLHL